MRNSIAIFLTLVACLFFPKAYATNPTYLAPVVVTASGTSTMVMGPNAFRQYLLIINQGAVSVYVKMGSVQSGTEGVTIPAGGNYEPVVAPTNGIWIDTASSTSTVTLIQGQYKQP